ncbi:MAG: DUF2520 domain-containing protein [Eubacterium sp.]|nr:DUF2520 domain-containing protein [Eubacterium sp.]
MQIGIIGAGKVGCSMGRYMREHGLFLVGYYSKSIDSSEEAGIFTDTKVFEDLESIIMACDMLCIATPDDAIAQVWAEIRRISEEFPETCSLEHKVLCHFSGSLSSEVFSGIDSTGASGCSIHPMSAFSDRFTSHFKLKEVIFTMEGQPEACHAMTEVFSLLGNKVLQIEPEKKSLYHCAASLVSNFMIGLYQMGLDLLEECGIGKEEGEELFQPLVEKNVHQMLWEGAVEALTGPIERGDAGTVQKHLSVLGESDAQIYRLLGQRVLAVAEEKNPERDYEAIRNIIIGSTPDKV